jgi:hypothetical protein
MTAICFGLYILLMYAGRFSAIMGLRRLAQNLYTLAFLFLTGTAVGVVYWMWKTFP